MNMKTFHFTSFVITCSMALILVNIGLLMPTPSGVSVAQARFPVDPRNENVSSTMVGSGNGAVLSTQLNYDLAAVLRGDRAVPRITLASFPAELKLTYESAARKAIFLKTVLPLVLQVNEQIRQDRTRLQALAVQQKAHRSLAAVDRLWLAVMATRYGTPRNNISALLSRHDVVPPSLALAQAATESAWGTSRFVREGNAMFGEWTFSPTQSGIVPLGREAGKLHRVRAFASLRDSIESYVTNLNKHRAYKEFRAMRRAMRKSGQPLNGMKLAGTLYRYSQRGMIYVDELRALMSSNDLSRADGVRLSVDGMIESLI